MNVRKKKYFEGYLSTFGLAPSLMWCNHVTYIVTTKGTNISSFGYLKEKEAGILCINWISPIDWGVTKGLKHTKVNIALCHDGITPKLKFWPIANQRCGGHEIRLSIFIWGTMTKVSAFWLLYFFYWEFIQVYLLLINCEFVISCD